MKSKMFILILSVLLISLFSWNVFSENTDSRIGLYYRLSPNDDTVSIDVFIQSASNVAGCQVWLTYNPTVLDYVDEVFEEGGYFPANAFYGQRQLESLSDTETRLRFAVASAPIENKNSGIIATLTFKVLNVEKHLPLSLVDGDLNKGTGTLFSDASGSLSLPGVVEPDDHSNIPARATPIDINLGQATLSSLHLRSGKIDYESDVDYFKIEVISPGALTVYSEKSSIDLVGQLFDSKGSHLVSSSVNETVGINDSKDQNFRIVHRVTNATLSTTKTYYVKVIASHNDSTGDYRFYAKFTPNESPDLVVESFGASLTGQKADSAPNISVKPNDEFYLHVHFKNAGTPTTDKTQVLCYQSANDTISESDELIVTEENASLTNDDVVVMTQAPETPGTYYYGVYVKEVADEINIRNNWSKVVKVAVSDPSNPHQVPLEFPKDLISQVAFGPNSTYFVLNPQFAKVPEKNKNENYFFYKSTITLDLGSKFIEDDSIQHPNRLPDEFPYLMMPFGETPGTIAETANEIAEGSGDKAFKITRKKLIVGGSLLVAGYIPIIGKFVGPIWLVIDLISTYINSINDSNAIVAAMREELREALTHPKMTIWNYSSFFYEDPVEIVDRPILFMIPERLTSIKVEIEQFFYYKKERIPIYIEGELESKDFWNWTLSLYPDPSQTFSEPIILIPSAGHSERQSSLRTFLDDAYTSIEGYMEGWLNIEPLGFLDTTEDRSDKSKFNEFVVGIYIHNSLNDLDEALKSDPELENLNIWELRHIKQPRGGIYHTNRFYEKIYIGRKRVTEYHNIWNLEETYQMENRGMAAPSAYPMSLADYPPFQQLPPEVQAYILQHFEGHANHKAINPEVWQIPEETSLLPNYPNPFNPETWIPYQLAQSADVSLTIYDIQGRVVRDLDLGHQRAGMYHSRSRAAYWDGRNAVGEPVATGVYFYTLTAGDFTATRKLLIRK